MRFADPKNDLAFKKIFGDINHKNILISFLNSVLDFKEGRTIIDVSLANPYQRPKIPELKETILDIKAKNKNGDTFIVEMQKKDLGDFTKRSLYYTSKAYIEQLPKGNDYTVLKKVYFIGILNFNIFDNREFVSRHLIINQETKSQDLDDFEFSFIELPKFTKEIETLSSTLDRWIYFLKHASDLTVIPSQYENIEEFKEAFSIATQTTWDKKELEVYDYISLKEFDELNALRTAERKGIEKGMEKGIEKGMEKGIEKEKISIAKNLLDLLDDETIAQKTGLDKDVVLKLRN
ncbi:MAG: Rpn family recombination-promoting nuclease/putative transposase [Campylobacterota bacterium]|nr:Rpn family recombination-promoting nuclease/putative transposase [Campylobacterota bacterium]